MTYPVLHPDLVPMADGYQVTLASDLVGVRLSGGDPRVRRGYLGSRHKVSLRWHCNKLKFDYLNAFYYQAALQGLSPFYMRLIINTAESQIYLCSFDFKDDNTASFGLTEQIGGTYIVNADLIVRPNPIDAASADNLIALFSEYGSSLEAVFNSLSRLPNIAWPSI